MKSMFCKSCQKCFKYLFLHLTKSVQCKKEFCLIELQIIQNHAKLLKKHYDLQYYQYNKSTKKAKYIEIKNDIAMKKGEYLWKSMKSMKSMTNKIFHWFLETYLYLISPKISGTTIIVRTWYLWYLQKSMRQKFQIYLRSPKINEILIDFWRRV